MPKRTAAEAGLEDIDAEVKTLLMEMLAVVAAGSSDVEMGDSPIHRPAEPPQVENASEDVIWLSSDSDDDAYHADSEEGHDEVDGDKAEPDEFFIVYDRRELVRKP